MLYKKELTNVFFNSYARNKHNNVTQNLVLFNIEMKGGLKNKI